MSYEIFESMKKQMIPKSALEAELKYAVEEKKRKSLPLYCVRWGCAAACFVGAVLCIFNLAMPAHAEKLPLVGKAFESLNDTGEESREKGITPSYLIKKEDTVPFSLSVTDSYCNGLDLFLKLTLSDNLDTVTNKADILTVANCAVETEGYIIYPTDENPRLSRNENGSFSGWAAFNASPIASFLSERETIEANLYCKDLSAYVEGATYEEVVSLYTYEFSYADTFSYETDLSDLTVEYLDMEKDGITILHKLSSGRRTDIVYCVDESIEYADCFSVFAADACPRSVIKSTATGVNGERTYTASFDTGDKYTDPNCEASEDIKIDSTYLDKWDLYIYDHATGEVITFEEEETKK